MTNLGLNSPKRSFIWKAVEGTFYKHACIRERKKEVLRTICQAGEEEASGRKISKQNGRESKSALSELSDH